MAEQKSSSSPVAPLRAAASAVRRVPGAEALSRAGEGILDKVESVSPRRRRLVVYAGAGVLGAVGVVEWPIALTGAAVAWLTQAGGGQPEGAPPAAGTARRTGAGTARTAGTGTSRAAKAPAAASKRASTGRRTSASAPASAPAPASASARKKTAPAARRSTTAKSGTSTRTATAKKGTSTRTTAKQGRTTR
ncbi:hypothetical protein [Streptomyces shenzhenensis]|uniref:hypothetical protein n=1 Tax=Streptomyces shenzhenensis TaxID=943815 RepID=UPI00217CD246|nr:hypothetical protein [Streptomyces shenzhenensis]